MNWVQPKFTDFVRQPTAKKRKVENKASQESLSDEHLDEDIPQLPTIWAPTKKTDLAVNKKKVDAVDQWLNQACFVSPSSSRSAQFLVLTGPPGSGKMTTLRVLSKERSIDLVEWCPQVTKRTYNPDSFDEYESELSLFETFVVRASRYASVLTLNSRRLVVVKDLPNQFLKQSTLFHEFIERVSVIASLRMVFVVTDSRILRDLFNDNLKSKANVTVVPFNPVTQTAVRSALMKVSKGDHLEVAKSISLACNGDLRHAIANLQFFTVKNCKTDLVKGGSPSVDLFHSLGRVLYGKRDPRTGLLVHDPVPIGESYASSPALFLGMLQENYLSVFGSISDVGKASEALAQAELIASRLSTDSVTHSSELGLVLACLGVMVSNGAPVKKFQQMNKPSSRVTSVLTSYRNQLVGVTDSFAVLDVLAYGKIVPRFATENHEVLMEFKAFRIK